MGWQNTVLCGGKKKGPKKKDEAEIVLHSKKTKIPYEELTKRESWGALTEGKGRTKNHSVGGLHKRKGEGSPEKLGKPLAIGNNTCAKTNE